MWTDDNYDQFVAGLKAKFPEMFSQPYGGVCTGAGWWPIIHSLCGNIDAYTKWRNDTRKALLANNPHNIKIPEEVPQVIVTQIKEKFGGLRFYYDGGDERIRGMVEMAESWASHACEVCGKPAISRGGGWIRTLCDEHEAERQNKMKNDRLM